MSRSSHLQVLHRSLVSTQMRLRHLCLRGLSSDRLQILHDLSAVEHPMIRSPSPKDSETALRTLPSYMKGQISAEESIVRSVPVTRQSLDPTTPQARTELVAQVHFEGNARAKTNRPTEPRTSPSISDIVPVQHLTATLAEQRLQTLKIRNDPAPHRTQHHLLNDRRRFQRRLAVVSMVREAVQNHHLPYHQCHI